MSQNRTFVPGIDDAGRNDFMYSRPTNPGVFSNGGMGTVVPGMSPKANGPIQHAVVTDTSASQQPVAVSGMPVIGFLYSISNQGIPEYWPVQLGYNRIGRNAENEVILNEQTVSGLHASIMVQKKRDGEVVAVIRIEQGRTGVFVNDLEVDLRYGSECKNGDVIQVGSNYTFIFILINAEASGLKVAENFIPVETSSSKGTSTESKVEDILNLHKPVRPTGDRVGTIAIDGSNSIEAPGGTRFM